MAGEQQPFDESVSFQLTKRDARAARGPAYARALSSIPVDRQPDAEKRTPETEWRRNRDIWGSIEVVRDVLLSIVEDFERAKLFDAIAYLQRIGGASAERGDPNFTDNPLNPTTTFPGLIKEIGKGLTLDRRDIDAIYVLIDGLIPKSIVDAKGDLIAGTASDTVARLAVGADGKVLTAKASEPTGLSWETPTGGVANPMTSDLDAGGFKITNYGSPTAAADVADKGYVDSVVVTDHGALTGLGDDDHTQYTLKSILTTKGDIWAATAASTPARVAVGANRRGLVADSTASPGVAWGGFIDQYVFAGTGTFDLRMDGAITHAALSTLAVTLNLLYAYPFIVKRPIGIDRIGYEVTTGSAGAGTVRLGIYKPSSETDPKPAALFQDSGEFSGADVETNGVKEKTVSWTLSEPGLYWMAFVAGTSAPTVRALPIGGILPLLGMDSTGGARNAGVTRSFTYAALPDPFAGTLNTRNGVMPQVFVRISSAS